MAPPRWPVSLVRLPKASWLQVVVYHQAARSRRVPPICRCAGVGVRAAAIEKGGAAPYSACGGESKPCYFTRESLYSVIIPPLEPFRMKKLFSALVCAIAMVPAVSSANIAIDTDTFIAKSSHYVIDFSWVDATYPWGSESNGLYGIVFTNASAWSDSWLTSIRLSSASVSAFNDIPGLTSGSFSQTYSGLTPGDIYKVGIAGVWLGSGGKVSIDSVAAAAPEPETYAMLLAGLGLVGFARRRASRS
jgi:hypothetical protein